MTPSHLLYGRRITSLPFGISVSDDDLTDPNYGNATDIRRRVKLQAIILQQFWKRWRRSSGGNKESIKKGDVVLVHDDGPRFTWKLAVVKDLIRGGDNLVQPAEIRTSTRHTNRPICKLYPLELSLSINENEGKEEHICDQENAVGNDSTEQEPSVRRRTVRTSAVNAACRISE